MRATAPVKPIKALRATFTVKTTRLVRATASVKPTAIVRPTPRPLPSGVFGLIHLTNMVLFGYTYYGGYDENSTDVGQARSLTFP
jgi:hypothetical protein